MIPLSIKRAQVLFAMPLSLSEFETVLLRNPHHWRDVEVILEDAQAALSNAREHRTQTSFVVRVRNGNHSGAEFASLVFQADNDTLVLSKWMA